VLFELLTVGENEIEITRNLHAYPRRQILRNSVTLTFDLLTSESVHAEVLPYRYVYQVRCR